MRLMGKKQRIARLEIAVMDAQAALASSDLALLEGARQALGGAVLDEIDHAREIGADKLNERMKERIAELQHEREVAQLQRRLTPCPCCRGTELIVSKQTTDLPFNCGPARLVVCRACGDARLQAEDPAAVAAATSYDGRSKLTRTITLPVPATGPFR